MKGCFTMKKIKFYCKHFAERSKKWQIPVQENIN